MNTLLALLAFIAFCICSVESKGIQGTLATYFQAVFIPKLFCIEVNVSLPNYNVVVQTV